MTTTYRFVLTVLIAIAPLGAALGQATGSYATIYDYPSAQDVCYDQTGTLGSGSAICSATVTGGNVQAWTASNNATRTFSSTITLARTDPVAGMFAMANTRTLQQNWIFLTGTSDASDRLVFRFLTSHTFDTESAVPEVGGAGTIEIDAPGDNAYDYREDPAGSNSSSDSQNATATAQGVDLSVAFGGFAGTYTYAAFLDNQAYLYSTGAEAGDLTSTWTAQLSGIDLVGADGRIRSASFLPDGSATLDVTSTPEPSSLVLELSALAALVGFTRRRMCKPRPRQSLNGASPAPARPRNPSRISCSSTPIIRSIARLSVALLPLAAQSAKAQTVSTNRGDFNSTVNWGDGFIDAPAGTTTVSVLSNGTLQTGVVGVDWGGGFTDGDRILFNGGGSFMQFDFASPITGFGTQAWFNYFAGTITIRELLGGTLKGSWTYDTGAGSGNKGQAAFFGVIDTAGFDRVVLTGNAPGFSEFAINDLSLNATATPEPASLMLVGTGLLAILRSARRRRRAAVGEFT